MTGTDETRLIVIRGNSGSGKSSLARAVRRIRPREIAIVEQDVLRRDILHVRDEPGNGAIGLIDLTARYALESGMHVVIEGILYDEIYGSMLRALLADHRGKSVCYRYELPFDETLRRHGGKEVADRFGAAEMRQWWRDKDPLSGIEESPIAADQSLNDAVQRIVIDCGW